MVGDNLENDIEPATHLGMHTYWIADPDSDTDLPYSGLQGTLADFLAWAKSSGLSEL